MGHTQKKLEHPARLLELNPEGTLSKLGLNAHDVVCDIGAGSGIFTLPASKMTSGMVFALDIKDELLALIREKAEAENAGNIRTVMVEGERFPLENGIADLALLVTVLHEIPNKKNFVTEIKRILKPSDRAAVIEFHKYDTPMGPPVPHRIAREYVLELLKDSGFQFCDEFELGDNYYCLVFEA